MEIIVNLTYDVVHLLTPSFQAYCDFVLGKFPHFTAYIVGGNALNAALRVWEAQECGSKPLYWLHSFVLVVLTGFGGGAVAPVLLGKPSVPLANDLVIPFCFVVWMLVHVFKLYPVLNWQPVKLLYSIYVGLFRTHTVCNIVAVAAATLAPGPYYPIPLVGPILAGTILGSIGAFLPGDKGLTPIASGTPWPMQGAFVTALLYHLLVNDRAGAVGGLLQKCVGSWDESALKVFLATVQIGTLLLQATVNPQANLFAPLHKVLYLVVPVPAPPSLAASAAAASAKPSTIGWDITSRKRLDVVISWGRLLVVIVAVAAHLVMNVPASLLPAGRFLTQSAPSSSFSSVLGVCQLPAWTHSVGLAKCSPYFLALEKVSGSSDEGAALRVAGYRGTSSAGRSASHDAPALLWTLSIPSTVPGKGKSGSKSPAETSAAEVAAALRANKTFKLGVSGKGQLILVAGGGGAGAADAVVWTSDTRCGDGAGDQGVLSFHKPALTIDGLLGLPMLRCPTNSSSAAVFVPIPVQNVEPSVSK